MAPRASGTHRFMFAHGGILWQATDYDSVEAETFVFRPGAGLVAVPVLSRRADQPRAREDRPVRYGERDKCGAPQRRGGKDRRAIPHRCNQRNQHSRDRGQMDHRIRRHFRISWDQRLSRVAARGPRFHTQRQAADGTDGEREVRDQPGVGYRADGEQHPYPPAQLYNGPEPRTYRPIAERG